MEGRKKYRRLRNELRRATEKDKKEYLESTCDDIIELQRARRYYFICGKTKEFGWKDNQENQTIRIEGCEGNTTVDGILGELYYRALRSS